MPIFFWIVALLLILPLAFSFVPRFNFHSGLRYAVPAILLSSLFFIALDWFFTWLGVWVYHDEHLIGTRLLNIPLEQYLYYLALPLAFLFGYEALNAYKKSDPPDKSSRLFLWLFFFLGVMLVILYYSHLYVLYPAIGICFTSLVLLIFRHLYFVRGFVLCWIIGVPLVLAIGALLASQPVITYSESEITGFRIFSAPVEILLHSFLLLLVNTAFYAAFKPQRQEDIGNVKEAVTTPAE